MAGIRIVAAVMVAASVGVIGVGVDAYTGAAFDHDPNPVTVTLLPDALPTTRRERRRRKPGGRTPAPADEAGRPSAIRADRPLSTSADHPTCPVWAVGPGSTPRAGQRRAAFRPEPNTSACRR
jgi:hypothetical protein